MASVSLIIPALNEAGSFAGVFANELRELKKAGDCQLEIICVDGGSEDATVNLARRFSDTVIELPTAQRGRSRQMNAGAVEASGDLLVFLHADTRRLSSVADFHNELYSFALSGKPWARCRVRLSGDRFVFRLIGTLMELRSRLSGICTGDQTLVIRKDVFQQIGGFADLPLMEDIDISRRLKRIARPERLAINMQTSSRRWEKHGVWRTIVLMWRLRLAWFMGVPAKQLAARYAAR